LIRTLKLNWEEDYFGGWDYPGLLGSHSQGHARKHLGERRFPYWNIRVFPPFGFTGFGSGRLLPRGLKLGTQGLRFVFPWGPGWPLFKTNWDTSVVIGGRTSKQGLGT